MTPRYYCTYFDSNYLPRFLALHASLVRVSRGPTGVFALCFDDTAHGILESLALPGVVAIRLADFEQGDDGLLAAKSLRTRIEYFFTCTPSLVLYVLRHWPRVDLVTYLDADLYFFGSPEPLFDEMGECFILIVPHRHAPEFSDAVRFGRYNVGFLSFRRSPVADACLRHWRNQCLEWCHDRCENGRFADQKYLDEWPTRFQGVCEVAHRGANVAPWNLSGYRVEIRREGVTMDGDPLLFYHFEGMHWSDRWLVDPGLSWPGRIPARVVRRVHMPYVREVIRWQNRCVPLGREHGRPGSARGRDTVALSWASRLRLLLEGRHIGVFLDRLVFIDSRLLRAVVRGWTRLRRR